MLVACYEASKVVGEMRHVPALPQSTFSSFCVVAVGSRSGSN